MQARFKSKSRTVYIGSPPFSTPLHYANDLSLIGFFFVEYLIAISEVIQPNGIHKQ